MTDVRLYLVIGVPVLLNMVALLWQSRAVEKTVGARIDALDKTLNARMDTLDSRIKSLQEVMDARFEAAHQALLRVEGVMDARLHALEDKGR